MERFYNPRNSGPLLTATHHGMGGLRGEGPYLELWLEIEDGQIVRASFETYGCPAAVACGSVLCDVLPGKNTKLALTLDSKDLEALLGGLPDGKGHCPELALDALRSALDGEDR